MDTLWTILLVLVIALVLFIIFCSHAQCSIEDQLSKKPKEVGALKKEGEDKVDKKEGEHKEKAASNSDVSFDQKQSPICTKLEDTETVQVNGADGITI